MKRRRRHKISIQDKISNQIELIESSCLAFSNQEERSKMQTLRKPTNEARKSPFCFQNNDLKQENEMKIEEEHATSSPRPLPRHSSNNARKTTRIMCPRRLLVGALLLATASLLISCIYCLQSETPANSLPAEPRAGDLPAGISGNAFDHLVKFLMANNQQQPQPQSQQQPFLNSQNNLRRVQQAAGPQLQVPSAQQLSTPVNPFLVPAFQPTRRQQNLAAQSNNNQLPPVVSSSSPTNYLTLNRLASLANQASRGQFNNNNNFAMPNRPNNNAATGAAASNRPMQPAQNVQRIPQAQQQRPQFSQPAGPQSAPQIQTAQTQSAPIFRAPAIQIQQPANSAPMKPMSGFAPSGPPPSSGLNNAMVVVPSPPNATGQPAATDSASSRPSSEPADQESPTMPTTTTTSASSPGSGGSGPSTVPPTSKSSTTPGGASSSEPTTSATGEPKAIAESPASNQTEWNPVASSNAPPDSAVTTPLADSNRKPSSLAPSPDIVTVPPDYNPDAPPVPQQSYDIAVRAQMGGPTQPLPPKLSRPAPTSSPSSSSDDLAAAGSSVKPEAAAAPRRDQELLVAPTETKTIYWSPPATELHPPTSPLASTPSAVASSGIQPSRASTSAVQSSTTPSRIRDDSQVNGENVLDEAGVVYGKPGGGEGGRDSKPSGPQVSPSQVGAGGNRPATIESSVAGRPYIQPVQIDNQVRPYLQQQPSAPSPSSSPSIVRPPFFKPSRPLNGHTVGGGGAGGPMSVASGFTIVANGNQTMPSGDIQDYLANQPPLVVSAQRPASSPPEGTAAGSNAEPVISELGGLDPALAAAAASESQRASATVSPNSPSSSTTTPSQPTSQPRIRRPSFRPKPKDPIQIDSCLPGDASSCDQSHNEYCHREAGISSCHCRPGFARLSQLRGYCSPVAAFQLALKIDKLSDERPLVFNSSLQDANQVEYQYLEFETLQALAGAMARTSLARQFMGAKVNKFFERQGKIWANVSVSLELQHPNNRSSSGSSQAAAERLQFVANQELGKIAAAAKPTRPLGDSTIILDGSRESVSRLVDVDECASRDLNDCARNTSICVNELGGFQCQCLPGYQDAHLLQQQQQQSDGATQDRAKLGRACLGCPTSYCSSRGECFIGPDGQKQCRCRANFMGARCDIDSEVLAVAVGGSLVGVIILVVTFWCLFVFNRRWRREQQKLDAMSATSGLTFNYVNSGGAGSSHAATFRADHGGAHYLAAAGQRAFGGGGGGAKGGAYDQRAIIGSTSSAASSSAASSAAAAAAAAAAAQQLACNPYAMAAAYHHQLQHQYDDAGLLIAPASSGSSEQTSPSASSYRAIMAANSSSYTLSGHHHNHHQHHHSQHHQAQRAAPISQFNPAAAEYCDSQAGATRWRTLQPSAGYYLSADMLLGSGQQHPAYTHQHQHQHQLHQQQQLYASAQRELCIDTGQSRKQRGRRPQV